MKIQYNQLIKNINMLENLNKHQELKDHNL